jgi:DNA topoisomerase-2
MAMSDDSLMMDSDGASSGYEVPKTKAAPKAKAAAAPKARGRPAKPKDTAAAPKAKPKAKTAPKKKPVIDSDDENSDVGNAGAGDDSDEDLLADTPPQAKKKAPPKKKAAGQPLADVANESFDMADGIADVPASKAKGGADSKYQMVGQLFSNARVRR